MPHNWCHTYFCIMKQPDSHKWEIRTVTLSSDELKKQLGEKRFAALMDDINNRLNVTIIYEFYDENDDMFPDQGAYAHVIGVKPSNLKIQLNNMSSSTLKKIISQSFESMEENLKKVIERQSRGEYTCIGYNAYAEDRKTYTILYIQYKLKKLETEVN